MNTVSVLVQSEFRNPERMNAVRIKYYGTIQCRSNGVIKSESFKNRIGEGLYTHYLCIQTKMMMLTLLDSQIAAPKHIYNQNGVFFLEV